MSYSRDSFYDHSGEKALREMSRKKPITVNNHLKLTQGWQVKLTHPMA